MNKKIFKIEMTSKDDRYAKVSIHVDASGEDVANMFHALVEQHEELIPIILAGIGCTYSRKRGSNH